MAGTRHTKKAGRKRQCVGKTPFETHAKAARQRERRIAQGAAEWTCTIYRCRFCGFRHVGHSSGEKYRQRARR